LSANPASDEFPLYDLRVEVRAAEDGRPMVCKHQVGDFFTVTDDDLISFPPGVSFPLFPLAALLPLLAAKTRELHPNDWMTTDTDIACPDPHCGGIFRISQETRRIYRHSEQTRVPLEQESRP
jgi:uncharacterized repeat protein (TIGR04076 family)